MNLSLRAATERGIIHVGLRRLLSTFFIPLLAFALADTVPAAGVNASNLEDVSDSVIDEPATEGPGARELVAQFLAAYDRGASDEAWGLMSPQTQAILPLAKWHDDRMAFLQTAGEPLAHDIERVTWQRDPPNAAQPGLYATFGIRCRYSLLQVCTEAVVLYRPYRGRDGGRFTILRHDRYAIDRAAMQQLCVTRESAYVDFGNGGVIQINCAPKPHP